MYDAIAILRVTNCHVPRVARIIAMKIKMQSRCQTRLAAMRIIPCRFLAGAESRREPLSGGECLGVARR